MCIRVDNAIYYSLMITYLLKVKKFVNPQSLKLCLQVSSYHRLSCEESKDNDYNIIKLGSRHLPHIVVGRDFSSKLTFNYFLIFSLEAM